MFVSVLFPAVSFHFASKLSLLFLPMNCYMIEPCLASAWLWVWWERILRDTPSPRRGLTRSHIGISCRSRCSTGGWRPGRRWQHSVTDWYKAALSSLSHLWHSREVRTEETRRSYWLQVSCPSDCVARLTTVNSHKYLISSTSAVSSFIIHKHIKWLDNIYLYFQNIKLQKVEKRQSK